MLLPWRDSTGAAGQTSLPWHRRVQQMQTAPWKLNRGHTHTHTHTGGDLDRLALLPITLRAHRGSQNGRP